MNIILIKKIDEIKFIFNHISSTVAMDLFNKDDLEDFDKSQYEDSSLDNSSNSDDNSLNSLSNDI